ncbi:MAG: hypothetical protein GY792_23760, partial [Gammaproteobacteria bacterium]|nr:hypothetical protein [Gammaproteobacteria bacterium]
GSKVHTATLAAPYGPDIIGVTVVQSDTVGQDFYLGAPSVSVDPESFEKVVFLGDVVTESLDLSNNGAVSTTFGISERDFGYTTAVMLGSEHMETIEWMYRNTNGVSVETTDSGTTIAYPGAYRYTPAIPSAYNILVYTDDWIHTTPNTLVQEALTNLGLAATVHVDGDYAGFEASLAGGGPWDLVIWSGENNQVPGTTLTALLSHLQGGGKLAATYWLQSNISADPLWAEMGFTYISNYVTPPPTYWWDPGHALFNNPTAAPEWITRVQNSGTSQGTNLEPLANGLAMAGYQTTPTLNEAGIILRDDGMALYKGLRDVSTNADDNTNGILDGTELWMNIMIGMLEGFGGGDIPWLSENPITGTIGVDSMQAIDVVFDSSVLTQTGWYSGELKVGSDDPVNGTIVIPVDMLVVSGTPGVALSADSTLVSSPGMQVTHTFTVTNTGDVIDIYDLALSGNAWDTTTPPANTSYVSPGETFTFTAVVDIPTAPSRDAIVGTDVFTVTATSQNLGVSASATGTTIANVATGVSLSGDQAATGMGGTVVTYTFTVTNTGEYTDTIAISASGTWAAALSDASATLGAGESATVELWVTVPGILDGVMDGDMDTTMVTATSGLDAAATASA